MASRASQMVSESASRRFTLAAPGIPFLAAGSLLVLALAPVWLVSHGSGIGALAIFAFFSKLCHQHAERSFALFGAPVAVCVRCLGIYAGAAFGSLVRMRSDVAFRWLGTALLLNCADVAAESIGLHGNLPLLRLLIGATLGIAVGAMFSVKRDAVGEQPHFADLLTR